MKKKKWIVEFEVNAGEYAADVTITATNVASTLDGRFVIADGVKIEFSEEVISIKEKLPEKEADNINEMTKKERIEAAKKEFYGIDEYEPAAARIHLSQKFNISAAEAGEIVGYPLIGCKYM